ncbi:large ribosomal subunit protein uL10m-like [Liolophura sinensis]|uniref:large ribosomal subunit protein uL10m-like n=1 Tax=Liolophura sinensis TaxID=3198878 RepID=UPI0031586CDF
MAAFRKGPLFQTTWMCVRHRGKVNIQRPRPGPWERRILEAMTVPIVLRDMDILKTDSQKCAEWREKNKKKIAEANPWEEFLVARCKEMFDQHKMVAVFQALPSKMEEKKAVHNKLMKQGLRLQHFPNEVMLQAIKNTKFVNLSPLLIGENLFVIGEEPNLPGMMKITRKVTHMALLGALVENRILSREEVTHYSTLPDLPMVRGQLASLLNSAASKTHRLLGSQQLRLSTNLEQYIKQRTEDGSSGSCPENS